MTFLLAANVAQAVPVQWTLNNWNLTSGGEVTGSFIYDADVGGGTFSNVSIWSGSTSFTFAGDNATATQLEFLTVDPSNDLTGTPVVLGQFGIPGMTNAGGTLFVLTQGGTNDNSSLSTCATADCATISNVDFLTAGNISGTVVPLPAAVWLLGSGLVALGAVSRLRKQTA